MKDRDLRMVPVAAGARAAAWAGTTGSGAARGGVALVALGVALLAWRRGSAVLAALACVLVAVGGSGAVRATALATSPVAALAREHAVADVVVEVRGDA